MDNSNLSDIRRFNKIASRISFVNFLLCIVSGLWLVMLMNFDWKIENQEYVGGCGVIERVPANLQTPTYLLGETIFKANCTSCHKIQEKLVGPALAGISDKYEKEWIYSFIRNSQEMVKEGDPNAVKIFNEYNESVMTSFPYLSDGDIDAILEYIEVENTAFEIPLP